MFRHIPISHISILKRNYVEDIGETLHVEDIKHFDIDFINRCVSEPITFDLNKSKKESTIDNTMNIMIVRARACKLLNVFAEQSHLIISRPIYISSFPNLSLLSSIRLFVPIEK